MKLNPPRTDWFFPIEEVPVLLTVTHKAASRDVRVPRKKALVAADTSSQSNTMTDLASRPPQSPRFRHDRASLERRSGAWLRDFQATPVRPASAFPPDLAELASRLPPDRLSRT